MPRMISRGRDLIRICPENAGKLESSYDGGVSWHTRYYGSGQVNGNFTDLLDNGREVLAQTTGGLYVSTDDCVSWQRRS